MSDIFDSFIQANVDSLIWSVSDEEREMKKIEND